MFTLSRQRDDPNAAPGEAFRRYAEYLRENEERFPPSAFALAASSWYHDFSDHRCPHDAWLEEVVLTEAGHGDRRRERALSLRICLLGAYHDGYVELRYPRVFRYDLRLPDAEDGHRDWRYDEIRVTANGRIEHEIEWWGPGETGRWLIEADDVRHAWIPLR